MSRRFRGHKSRSIFAQEIGSTQAPLNNEEPTIQASRRHTQNQQHHSIYNDEPIISSQNDTITLTGDNYRPNATLIGISGFDSLSPFMSSSEHSKTLDTTSDNRYNDYNEGGPNDINGGDYRQRLIRQMQQSMFKQSDAMFGASEHVSQSKSHGSSIQVPQYDVDNNYTPSNAQSVYLQKQSKNLFKNINN